MDTARITDCDARCKAAVQVVVRKPGAGDAHGMGELGFCGHHFHDLHPLLALDGWTVIRDGRPGLAGDEERRRAA